MAFVKVIATTPYLVAIFILNFRLHFVEFLFLLSHPVVSVRVNFLLSLPDKYTHQNIRSALDRFCCENNRGNVWLMDCKHTYRAVNRVYNQSSIGRRSDVKYVSRLRAFALGFKTLIFRVNSNWDNRQLTSKYEFSIDTGFRLGVRGLNLGKCQVGFFLIFHSLIFGTGNKAPWALNLPGIFAFWWGVGRVTQLV